MPFLLDPASQRGVTRSHTAPRCGIQKMLERESPQDTFLLRPSLARVAARGDALGHTAPRCGIQEKFGRESPQNTFLLRPSLDPASQRGVTRRSYRTLMRYPGKDQARVSAKSIPFTSLSGPASQRGVTRSHTAPRCGIQKKLGQESPQNTFPFTFLSGPASQRWVTLSVIPHPDAVSRKRSGKSVRQIHSFYVPLWTRVAARGDVQSYRTPMRYPPGMLCDGLRLSVLPIVLDVQTGGESRKSGKSLYICPP